mgnify:CR=1 FL=1|jgi:hypothetical protein
MFRLHPSSTLDLVHYIFYEWNKNALEMQKSFLAKATCCTTGQSQKRKMTYNLTPWMLLTLSANKTFLNSVKRLLARKANGIALCKIQLNPSAMRHRWPKAKKQKGLLPKP